MGKHTGNAAPETPGTTTGTPFEAMTGAEKAHEFDQSHADPVNYANRNFPAATPGEQYRTAAANQTPPEQSRWRSERSNRK